MGAAGQRVMGHHRGGGDFIETQQLNTKRSSATHCGHSEIDLTNLDAAGR